MDELIQALRYCHEERNRQRWTSILRLPSAPKAMWHCSLQAAAEEEKRHYNWLFEVL